MTALTQCYLSTALFECSLMTAPFKIYFKTAFFELFSPFNLPFITLSVASYYLRLIIEVVTHPCLDFISRGSDSGFVMKILLESMFNPFQLSHVVWCYLHCHLVSYIIICTSSKSDLSFVWHDRKMPTLYLKCIEQCPQHTILSISVTYELSNLYYLISNTWYTRCTSACHNI